MSIINDALKKAEKNKHLSQHQPAQILTKIVDQIKTDAQKFVLRKWLIWAGTGVICLLGVILTLSSFRGSPERRTPASISAEVKATQPEVAQKSALPLREKKMSTLAKTSDFNLSGILYDKEKPLAIINERIVGEGALINGAELLEIQPNYVRLSFKEKEFKLKLK